MNNDNKYILFNYDIVHRNIMYKKLNIYVSD